MNQRKSLLQIKSFIAEKSTRGRMVRLVCFLFLYYLAGLLRPYYEFLADNSNDVVNQWLSKIIATISTEFLRPFYHNISFNSRFTITINGLSPIELHPGCNGFNNIARIILTLCFYPIPIIKKLFLFPISFLIVLFAATIHFLILIPVAYEVPDLYGFAHSWFTHIVFYMFYFSCWFLWEKWGWNY